MGNRLGTTVLDDVSIILSFQPARTSVPGVRFDLMAARSAGMAPV